MPAHAEAKWTLGKRALLESGASRLTREKMATKTISSLVADVAFGLFNNHILRSEWVMSIPNGR
ncbi:hypothetical protein AUI06_01840 [archaeon 13_2_20CM_2_52_21]|nr:MAG: hypothetical protein AUI06_01840 [archaeon 13_2_20CM_2_52_21]